MTDRTPPTILLVDSSTTTLFYHAMLLKRLAYKVVTARSAEEALRLLAKEPISLVLTELSLPTMSGIAFLTRIKDTTPLRSIPVVTLTLENDPALKDTCMRMGCAAYLQKPVDPRRLYQTIQAVSESIPRAHIRLNTSLKVIVGDGTAMGGVARTEFATALSEGGLYVRTLYPQPRNAVTPLHLFINDREIRATAVVLYSYDLGEGPFQEPGMGMKFVHIDDEDRQAIRDFIEKQLTSGIAQP